MRTFFIETWGCQMNLHDSERLEGQLLRQGLSPATGPKQADLVLLNTCSVREKAVQKIISRIGELEKLPQPPAIGVCGCVAQQEGRDLLSRSKAVAFVLGPSQLTRLPEAVEAARTGERQVIVGFKAESDHSAKNIVRKSATRGMVTVMEGCEEHCTFCVVPYTRGHEVSRPAAEILDEVRSLVDSGLFEIELLGQTINAYRCPTTQTPFAELLNRVAQVKGLGRLRFVTSHPRHFNDELIRVMADNESISRYLHLPFQAGSNTVLKRMHRRYTREQYLDLIRRIRSAVPEVNLSTDVITGFPGETEDDFQLTLDLIEEVRFGQVFAFAYSPRPRTPAANLEDDVPESTKKQRLHRLFEISDKITKELNTQLLGSILEVLIVGDSRRSDQDWQGRGEDNRIVNFAKTGKEGVGDIVRVRISSAGAHSLTGEIQADPSHLPVIG